MGEKNTPFLGSCGFIPVKIDGECGYYDIEGNEVIPVGTFAEVRPVHNNLAWVKNKTTGLWGVIEIVQDKPNWRELYAEKLRDYIASNDSLNDVKFDLYDLNGNLLDKVSLVDEIIDELNQYSGFEFNFCSSISYGCSRCCIGNDSVPVRISSFGTSLFDEGRRRILPRCFKKAWH